ncbi:MAG TPA: hypothetical protein DHV42_03630 [Lachnospiraceae bacterium]|nr:hypothetical protein [Lachnospiraceae bacterium]
MDVNQMFGIMDFIMVGAGLYLLYAWYLLKFKNQIKEGVLIQSGGFKRCKDIEGYKKYIAPKLLLFALCALASGALGLYSDYVKPVNNYVYLGCTGLFFVVLVLFVRYIKKAQTMFF